MLLLGAASSAADNNQAHFDYAMNCQGCHGPDANGSPGRVPKMKDFVGYFLHSDEGRAFVVRVPGVSGSPLTNAGVANLLNWLLATYSPAQLPKPFVPYTESEVAGLRSDPETNPDVTRIRILRSIAAATPDLKLPRTVANGTGKGNPDHE